MGIDTNILNKAALVTDINPSYQGMDVYCHARNLVPYSHQGDEGLLGNEPSNTFCFAIPGTFIGSIDLHNDTHIIFSVQNGLSIIGIGDLNQCSYSQIVSSSCLGFMPDVVMYGVSKKLFNNNFVITFGQKGQPIYRLDLGNIPYTYSIANDICESQIDTTTVDCSQMLLSKLIVVPTIDLEAGLGGSLPNGVYNIAVAYMVDAQVFSDYYVGGEKIQVHEILQNNSINLQISNLDRDFTYYQLVIIGNIDGVRTAKIVGEYPTFQSYVTISDFNQQITVPLESLVLKKKCWESAGIISSNSNYLLLGDLTTKSVLNYQPQAMNIVAKYVVTQVPEDYYAKTPTSIQYYGDENYDFSIEWWYNTGEVSHSSHIPGRKKTTSDQVVPTGTDVYEWDLDIKPTTLETWQTMNTASPPIPTNNQFVNSTRVAYTGTFGYFESTELYPDNAELFPNDKCTPIRYHKFPDETLVPRYEVINGVKYLNLKSVMFSNITYPLDTNGNRVVGIVGYRILRSERSGGNKTVISTGLFSNVRTYLDNQNQNREVMFANYPYNDLSPDSFLSTSQTTYRNNSEQSYTPVTGFYNTRFNYYSPHSLYNLKYKHGTEFKFYGVETASVTGNFEQVYGHPKAKLISNFSFWTASMIGVAEAYLEASGATSKSYTGGSQGEISELGVGAGTAQIPNSKTTTSPRTALSTLGTSTELLGTKIAQAILSYDFISIPDILNILADVVLFIAELSIDVILFTMTAMKFAQNILDIIYNLLSFNQYAYQYNSVADFNNFIPSSVGNIRRIATSQPQYLSSNVHTINSVIFNNFGKQDSVYVEIASPIDTPGVTDTTRRTISDFGIGATPLQKNISVASMYYGASRVSNPNQYNQLGSVPQVLISENLHTVSITDTVDSYTTPILFGGDCIIAKQSIITKHPFFRQNLAVEQGNTLPTNLPDGTEFDYNFYRNIAYPRYWIDTTKYDYSSLLTKSVTNFTTFSGTATSKHNLDNKGADEENVFEIDDAYFYIYNNGVIDFYAECDFNISFREFKDIQPPWYSAIYNNNLSDILKSTNISRPEVFILSRSYSDLAVNEIFSKQLYPTYKSTDMFNIHPNAVVYSLPSFNLQTYDNWQFFPSGNFFSFRDSDFGQLVNIRKIDQDRLIFLFTKASPYISLGKDFIQLDASGRKVTIGDGGLFAQDPRQVQPTDNNFGACNSKWGFISNQFGYFYPSEKQGKYFNFTGRLDDITNYGMGFWANNYMNIQLYTYFPTFVVDNENPINNVGYLTVFDSSLEILYIVKRDFIPVAIYAESITYRESDNTFLYNGNVISLKDTRFFEDISWVLSYDCTTKAFISFHDWAPDWTIQTDNHFCTVKNNAVWKHNERWDSYCNFYGKDYPFEVEFVNTSKDSVDIVNSIEYQLEAYTYSNEGRDRFHILYENFDTLIVSNTEQCSPMLNIVRHPENPRDRLFYPKNNGIGWDILYTKLENRLRINQFWDSIRDRGQNDSNEANIFTYDASGYRRSFNNNVIDISKPEKQRKRFRHYFTKFYFIKNISSNIKMMIKLVNTRKTQSAR